MSLTESFKAYDVRGIVGSTMTDETVAAVAAGCVDVLELAGDTVVVGGDMRDSSERFMDVFSREAAQRGANVVKLGVISTDMLYYACGVFDTAGVMFTASHNPAEYNGMKLARPGAVPVSSETGLFEIRDAAQRYLDAGSVRPEADTGSEQPAPPEGTITEQDILADYAQYLRGLVDVRGNRKLTVVVDAGNGMAGKTTPAVLGDATGVSLPLEIIPLYFELDGTFPNHPADPLNPKNLVDLQSAVVEHGADLGLAFDGDADRCFVIDERGVAVSPSAVTGLVARREIARALAAGEEQPVVIHNLITSRAVPELVKAEGGRAVQTRVGHSFIKSTMAETGAIFGGEHSAHYYFRDFFNADTGMLAALHVLAALGSQSLPLSVLAAEYSPYFSSGEINLQVPDKDAAVTRVVTEFTGTAGEERTGSKTTTSSLDGVTVMAADSSWWFNLRPSNTEPLLRFNGESADQATMEQIRDDVLNVAQTLS